MRVFAFVAAVLLLGGPVAATVSARSDARAARSAERGATAALRCARVAAHRQPVAACRDTQRIIGARAAKPWPHCSGQVAPGADVAAALRRIIPTAPAPAAPLRFARRPRRGKLVPTPGSSTCQVASSTLRWVELQGLRDVSARTQPKLLAVISHPLTSSRQSQNVRTPSWPEWPRAGTVHRPAPSASSCTPRAPPCAGQWLLRRGVAADADAAPWRVDPAGGGAYRGRRRAPAGATWGTRRGRVQGEGVGERHPHLAGLPLVGRTGGRGGDDETASASTAHHKRAPALTAHPQPPGPLTAGRQLRQGIEKAAGRVPGVHR